MTEPKTFFLLVNRNIQMCVLAAFAIIALTITLWWVNPAERFFMLADGPVHYILLSPLKLIVSVAGLSLLLGTFFAFFIWRANYSRTRLILRSSLFMTVPVALIFLLPAAWGLVRNMIEPTQRFELVLELEPSNSDEAESAPEQFYAILNARLDRFGQGWIEAFEKQDHNRVRLIIAGHIDQEKITHYLVNGELGFYETVEYEEGFDVLNRMNSRVRALMVAGEIPLSEEFRLYSLVAAQDSADLSGQEAWQMQEDSAVPDPLHPARPDGEEKQNADEEEREWMEEQIKYMAENPVLGLISPPDTRIWNQKHPLMGYVKEEDKDLLKMYFALPQLKDLYSNRIHFLFTTKPRTPGLGPTGTEARYDLVAVLTGKDNKPAMSGKSVSDAHVSFQDQHPCIALRFDAEGSRQWERLTHANVGRCIAMVVNEEVYSYPNVQSKITGGRAQISGNFTIEEAKDLANIIRSGDFPVHAKILSLTNLGQ